MPGRPPKVDHIRKGFLNEIRSARTLVSTVGQLPRKIQPSNKVGIHPKYVEQITGLAFMGVVSAWEEFLELTLVRYVAGAAGTNYSPVHKFGSANSIAHSYELLSQNPNYDPQKNYLKVNDSRWVLQVADFIFDQHPYGNLSSKTELLRNALNIRNRIAHNSSKSRSKFKETAVWFLQPKNNLLRRSYGPGTLLSDKVKRHFKSKGQSHFIAYLDLYESLAEAIVP